MVVGQTPTGVADYEIYVVCRACGRGSIYDFHDSQAIAPLAYGEVDLRRFKQIQISGPTIATVLPPTVSGDVPKRVADLFREAATSRQLGQQEAAGAIFRKTIDVASKHIYATDTRLAERQPAEALRSRLKALAQMKILDEDIVELADVAALDGNDAAHDVDPYTAEEAEALEDLTKDLLDRLFVRPARLAAVKAKQIAAGQRIE